jgi:hypothetical protein
MEWLTLLGLGGSLLSGFLGQQGARQASEQQVQAIQRGLNLEQRMLGTGIRTISRTAQNAGRAIAPWLTAGRNALAQYQGELGLSSTGANGRPFRSGFRRTPGYQFQVQEGERAAVNNLRSLGMGASGAALKALTRFRQGLADQTYNSYLDRLRQQSDTGLNAGGMESNIMMGGAHDIADLYMNGGRDIAQGMAGIGAAQASGTVGGTNSWLNALGNGMTNIGRSLGQYGSGWDFLRTAQGAAGGAG